MLISRSVLPIYPALSDGGEDKLLASINTRCSVVLLNEPYLYCHVLISKDDHAEIGHSDAQQVYRDETYGEALKLLAQRTPVREYAAALEVGRVPQTTT